MVTHVLGKNTKVKNNFVNGKKKFKRILSCLFGERRKVQVTNLLSRTSSQVVVSAANSVGTTLEFTHLAVVLRQNLAELVPSGFLCPKQWFLRWSEHYSPRKNTRVYHNTVTCVIHETSNRVEIHLFNSQHLANKQTNTRLLCQSRCNQ